MIDSNHPNHPAPEVITLPVPSSLRIERRYDNLGLLAGHMAIIAAHCTAQFVREFNPLAETYISSWIWKRASGQIQVVRAHRLPQRPNCEALVEQALFIEAFRSQKDAVASSKFHRCSMIPLHPPNQPTSVPDGWNQLQSISKADAYAAANEEMYMARLNPLSNRRVMALLGSARYRQDFQKRILNWILAGRYQHTFRHLNAKGLRNLMECYPTSPLMLGGANQFYEQLRATTRHALVSRVLQNDHETSLQSLS